LYTVAVVMKTSGPWRWCVFSEHELSSMVIGGTIGGGMATLK
jgi:hypothetical protein